MRWFKTKREAQKEADKRNKGMKDGNQVFHKRGDKKVKPFWVGTHLEWLNR